MARHKKIQTEEQGDPEMEISSMIDCCFLLLIYFLVATSLVSEKKFDMALPAGDSSSSTSDSKSYTISVASDNSVDFVDSADKSKPISMAPASDMTLRPGDKGYYEERNLEELIKKLKGMNTNPSKPMPITLTASPHARHQRVMDVMSALTQADIKAVRVEMSDK